MSLTVKAYLEVGKKPEIRRFGVDQDVSTNFEYMKKKVIQVFPAIATKNFTMYWKDAENDYIAFSSDDELLEALTQLKEDLFRVHIKVDKDKCDENVLHPHVVCDSCEGAIRGARFKCTVCRDYDLCSTCESHGVHTEHEMIRISTPRQRGQGWMGFMPPHFGPPHGHPRGPHGHPPGPHGNPPGPHGPHHGPHGFPGDPHGEPRYPGPPFGRWMRHAMRHMWQTQQGEEQNAEGQNSPNGEKSQESATAEGQEGNVGADYLRCVGETVAAMLDPMGIDVEVDVEHGDRMTRCGGKKSNGQKKTEKGKKSKKTQQTDVEMEAEAGNQGDSKTQTQAHQDEQVEAGKQANQEEPMEPAKQASQESPMEAADGQQKNSNQADVGWTFLSSGEQTPPSDTSNLATSAQTGTSVYPTLPPQDPRIAEVLKQMQAMGFSDEGGWLSQLLIAKQGDMGKVLDALQPARQA